ncbi:MAG TPA: CHAT domain-containing tetratricopeptide repeat protein [Vicinamibacterales bacterium]|nr:CHAT domain-containing tetratricopeptide repeat protein [Vicinamibacterales bacterium]
MWVRHSTTRLLAATVCLAAALCAGHRPLDAQSPAPPRQGSADASAALTAVITRFFAAPSDDGRAAVLKEAPELAGEPARPVLFEHALSLLTLREYPAAERAYRAILWLATATNNPRSRSSALTGLGSVDGQRGNLASAQSHLTEALQVAEAIGDPAGLQPVISNLAIVQRRLGDFESAQASFDRALALAEQLRRPIAISRVYNNLGLMHSSLGNARLAHDYFSRSLDLKVDDGGRGTLDIANTLNNIGGQYDELGDYPQALTYYTRALALIEKVGVAPAATSTWNNIGRAHANLNQPGPARTAFDRALAMAEASDDSGTVATLLYNMGTLSRDEGKLAEAETLQRRSLELRERSGDVAGLVESLSEMASLLLIEGRAREGEPYIARAMQMASSSRLLAHLGRAQLFQGQIHEALGRTDAAIASYEAGITTAETLRTRTVGGERARQVFMTERVGAYLSVAALHARAGRGFDALMAVERARARTLLDILAAGRQPTRTMTAAERDKERRLSNVIVALGVEAATERQQRAPDAARIAALEADLAAARLAHEAFTAELYGANPDLRIIRGDAPILSRGQLAAILTPGTAVLELVVQPESAWAYLVKAGPDGPVVTAKQLETTTDQLLTLADRFANQVSGRDLGFAATSAQLYSALLGAFDTSLSGVSHLIVVPDHALWRVPFQALLTPRDTFLVEERAVSYTPSLSALIALRERRARRVGGEPRLLALGDPALAPDGATPGLPERLPEAAREVQALERLYGANRSAVFLGSAATEGTLRAAVRNASVLHIATHGVLDDRSPMYSHLLMAPDKSGDGTDGRLEAWELLDLEITADLVVLSACQTASGAVGGGEGVIGLSWALFAAGASTAVVSQWEVDSASTTALMIGLHERLLAPKAASASAAESLRGSALALMKDPRYRHPFYWAGFIVMANH